MQNLSQNKKIALASALVFVFSFVSMIFFLDSKDQDHGAGHHGQANVLHIPSQAVEPYLEEVLANNEQAVLVSTPEGVLKHANDYTCGFLFKNCDKWFGKNVFDLIQSDDHSELFAAHSKVLQEQKEIDGVGPVLLGTEGAERLVMVNIKPIVAKDDKVKYIVFYLKDITEKIEALQ